MFNGTMFLSPRPLGPWEGKKGQISLKFNYKVNCKDFLNQNLCVFSQMKDIKHIRRDFYPFAWVMPQRLNIGVLGGQKISFPNMVTWQIKLKGVISRPGYPENFILRSNWRPWVQSKGQITLDFFESVGICDVAP